MPIGSIPMPDRFINSLISGEKSTQDMINSILSNKREATQTGLNVQANARNEKILPYLLQKYADEHQGTVDSATMQKWILHQALGGESPFQAGAQSAASPSVSPAAPGAIPGINAPIMNAGAGASGSPMGQGASAAMASPGAAAPAMGQSLGMAPAAQAMPGNAPSGAAQTQAPLNRKLTEDERRRLVDYAMNNDLPAEKLEQIQNILTKDELDNVPQGTSQTQNLNPGQEIMIHPGIPGQAWKNKLAGVNIPGMGVKVPGVQTKLNANGDVETTYPNGMVTLSKNPNIMQANAQQKMLEKSAEDDATIMKGVKDRVISSYAMNDKYNALHNIIKSNTWAGIRKSPIFGSKEISYFEQEGTPEQKYMVGQFKLLSNDIIGDVMRNYAVGSRAYASELPLAIASKVGESDSIESSQGKVETALMLRDLDMKRGMRALELWRKYNYPPEKALEQADKDVNGALYRKIAQKKLGLSDRQLTDVQTQATGNQEQQAPGKITIIDSTGKEHTIDEDKLSVAQQRDPGLKVKGK